MNLSAALTVLLETLTTPIRLPVDPLSRRGSPACDHDAVTPDTELYDERRDEYTRLCTCDRCGARLALRYERTAAARIDRSPDRPPSAE
ncbi:hypothetical protein ACFQPA_03615 [Halomarina halobia]|uniref:Halobacterial output domain-containing protein n=1 Tax=Halomarina halobia TaxID=3033386 RepID=A0ABD6A4G7_9EURY|nr:hypothetical protein [Halomarina sp. PSR21]